MPCTVTWYSNNRVVIDDCDWVRVKIVMTLAASGTNKKGKYQIRILPRAVCDAPNSTATLLERVDPFHTSDTPVNMPPAPPNGVINYNNWSIIGRQVSWSVRNAGAYRMLRDVTVDSMGTAATEEYEHEIHVLNGPPAKFDIQGRSANCLIHSVIL